VSDLKLSVSLKHLKSKNYLEFVFVSVGSVLSYLIIVTMLWGLKGLNPLVFSQPISMSGDALWMQAFVKRLSEGWYWNTERLGFPFGSNHLDYPIPDLASTAALKLLVEITHSPVAAINLFFIGGYPLAFIFTYVVTRKFNISRTLSFVSGIVYTFLWFHIERFGHLFFTWYFIVPLFFLISINLYENKIFNKGEFFFAKIKFIFLAGFLSLFGIYYVLFGVIVISTTIIVQLTKKGTGRSILFGLYSLFILFVGLFLCVLPSLVYRLKYGVNHAAVLRSPGDSEMYGLKLIQLILPRAQHRISSLSTLNSSYSSSRPLVNENFTSSLGLICAVGFLMLVFFELFKLKMLGRIQSLQILSPISLVLFLFGTIGGLGSVFSFVITGDIRSWNRISIFIAFPSLIGVVSVSEHFLSWIRKIWSIEVKYVFSALLLVTVYVDQMNGFCIKCNSHVPTTYFQEDIFFKRLEAALPENAAVYQLPFMSYPEGPPLFKLDGYGQLSGYVHTKNMRWSYGLIKGREGDNFYRMLSSLDLVDQVAIIKRLGFNAVYVDRNGYEDNGEVVVAELMSVLGQPLIEDSDGRRVVFKVPSQSSDNFDGLSAEQMIAKAGIRIENREIRYIANLEDGIDFSKGGLPSFVKTVSGLSGVEQWGRWSDANLASVVEITFASPLPKSFSLVVKGSAFGPNIGRELVIVCGKVSRKVLIDSSEFILNEMFDLESEDVTIIKFIPSRPISPKQLELNEDGRLIAIGFKELKIQS
jgi:phosphoglycerol transferase